MKAFKSTFITLIVGLLVGIMVQDCFAQYHYNEILFVNNNFEKAQEIANKKDKLIFIDFYTDWCGPCKIMEEEVFTQQKVADFYNDNFINLKIDAEKGEGVKLDKKYGVQVYPTYVFLNPKNGKLVHKATSRQTAEEFIQIGKSALSPELRSINLTKEYENENRSKAFLRNYLDYLSRSYQRTKIDKIIEEYTKTHTLRLEDGFDWFVFANFMHGIESPEFKYLIDHSDALKKVHTSEEVNSKIAEEYRRVAMRNLYRQFYRKDSFSESEYNSIVKKIEGVEFNGKTVLLDKLQVWYLLGKEEYDQAAQIVDQIATNSEMDKEELLYFYRGLLITSRNNIKDGDWYKYCFKYARYIAYNHPKRRDPYIHYQYAQFLERALKSVINGATIDSTALIPQIGTKKYDIRYPDLEPKPKNN